MTKKLMMLTCIFAALTLGWLGCDEENLGPTGSESVFDPSPSAQYFPLAPNYSITYQVVESNGHAEIVTTEVGPRTPFLEYEGYPVTTWDGSHRQSSSWIVATDSALYFFETSSSQPERILSLPLLPGRSWNRNDLTGLDRFDDGSGTDTLTDIIGDGGGGGLGESPTIIASTGDDAMRVQTIEIVELETGDRFGGVIRVVNTDAVGRDNMYWFAPGIGMIKYALSVSDGDLATASVTAEMIQYGFGRR